MRVRRSALPMEKRREIEAPCRGEENTFNDIDETIPVCMGEFGLTQARLLRDLWEATWSQDSRRITKK